MTAKKYLSEVQRLQTIIKRKQEWTGELRGRAYSIRAVHYGLEKVQGSGHADNPLHIQVLYGRYIEGRDFRGIADEMRVSYRYSLKLHDKALEAFGIACKKILREEEMPPKTAAFSLPLYCQWVRFHGCMGLYEGAGGKGNGASTGQNIKKFKVVYLC